MKVGPSEKRSVTPKQAIEILGKHGYKVNEEEAGEILDFLYFLGNINVDRYIKETTSINNNDYESSRSIRKG